MAGGRSTVLVVDDDPVILSLLQVNFELEGFAVLTAGDAATALDLTRRHRPDVVVAAEPLGGVDGPAVVAALRDGGATSDTLVVLLSGDVETGAAAGADDFLTKPFEPIDLVGRVRRLLRARPRR